MKNEFLRRRKRENRGPIFETPIKKYNFVSKICRDS